MEKLLELIRQAESNNNYDVVYANKKTHKPLTQMWLGEVRAFQEGFVSGGSPSSAVGAYQIIRSTFDFLMTQSGFSPFELFNKETQDEFALQLLNQRGLDDYVSGHISIEKFGLELAREWASLPLLDGPNQGKSYYDKDGLNKALISDLQFRTILKELK